MSAENNAFWKQYDLLLVSLETHGLTDVQLEVTEAKRYVNGYTDGWHQLLEELKRIEAANRDLFVPEQRAIFYYLISQLRASLYPR